MALIFGTTEVKSVFYNGTELDKVYYNGTLVFEKSIKLVENGTMTVPLTDLYPGENKILWHEVGVSTAQRALVNQCTAIEGNLIRAAYSNEAYGSEHDYDLYKYGYWNIPITANTMHFTFRWKLGHAYIINSSSYYYNRDDYPNSSAGYKLVYRNCQSRISIGVVKLLPKNTDSYQDWDPRNRTLYYYSPNSTSSNINYTINQEISYNITNDQIYGDTSKIISGQAYNPTYNIVSWKTAAGTGNNDPVVGTWYTTSGTLDVSSLQGGYPFIMVGAASYGHNLTVGKDGSGNWVGPILYVELQNVWFD